MNNVIIDPADSKYQPMTNVIRDTKEPKYQTVFTFQLMSSVIKEKKKICNWEFQEPYLST